jgi:thiamine biosynthesis lipoprotein
MPRDASFEAMGVAVAVRGATAGELESVRSLFERWEQAFSRFRPQSELSRVNRSGGVTEVSPLFAHVLERALRVAAATDGLVDPTLGEALESAGYDRDFDALTPDERPPGPPSRGRWRELRLVDRILIRPDGVTLDLNGVVKALAADEALQLLAGDGFVAAGGDVAVRGSAVLALPEGGAVRVLGGGIATSGTRKRRWLRAGRPQHHLIDPATGVPSTSRWLDVTVAAGSCLAADVAAKTAFLLDGDGPDWLEARALPGRFTTEDGIVVETGRWHRTAEAA